MDYIFFLIVLLVVGIILVFKTRKSYVIESTLETMRKSCKSNSQYLHVFVDAGADDLSSQQAMDCMCRALDMADCPENINIIVIIPTKIFSKRSSWDVQLESTCSAQSRYATFFENNVHLYKMGVSRYATGGLQIVSQVAEELEIIKKNDLVMWLPLLTKLEMHWDANIWIDWSTLLVPKSILSYPLKTVPSLEQDIEGFLLRKEVKSTPSYYFINSFFNLECRSLVKPDSLLAPLETLYASTRYPLVMSKDSLISLREIFTTEEEFQFSYGLFSKSYKIFLGMHAIGFSYLKNTSSVPNGLDESLKNIDFQNWASDIGLHMSKDSTIKVVLLHGKLGVGKHVTLEEKIIKYGTEIKFQAFREALIAEELEREKKI